VSDDVSTTLRPIDHLEKSINKETSELFGTIHQMDLVEHSTQKSQNEAFQLSLELSPK
jgi:hypothetical protein